MSLMLPWLIYYTEEVIGRNMEVYGDHRFLEIKLRKREAFLLLSVGNELCIYCFHKAMALCVSSITYHLYCYY